MKNQPVKCMIQTIQKLFNRVILFEMMNIKLFGSGQKGELVRGFIFLRKRYFAATSQFA